MRHATAVLYGVYLGHEHTLHTAFGFFLSFGSLSFLLVTSCKRWFYAWRTELLHLQSGWYKCVSSHNLSVHCLHVQFSCTSCILICLLTSDIFISLVMVDLVTVSAVQIEKHLMRALLVNNDLERMCWRGRGVIWSTVLEFVWRTLCEWQNLCQGGWFQAGIWIWDIPCIKLMLTSQL